MEDFPFVAVVAENFDTGCCILLTFLGSQPAQVEAYTMDPFSVVNVMILVR